MSLFATVTVQSLFTLAKPHSKFGFTGVGYSTKGGRLIYDNEENPIHAKSVPRPSDDMILLEALLYASGLCNNATLSADEAFGQPTELAMLVAVAKAGLLDPRPQYKRIKEIPFSSERKRMEVCARPVNGRHSCELFQRAAGGNDGALYFVKGMPEKVLDNCKIFFHKNGTPYPLDEECRTMVLVQGRRMSASGLRVIAVAFGPTMGQLAFAGLMGLEDPPREGVVDSVRHLRQGGVKCLMITGDSKETAIAIGRRCGILGKITGSVSRGNKAYPGGEVDDLLRTDSGNGVGFEDDSLASSGDLELAASQTMSGAEIDDISPTMLANCINAVKIFYRVSPRHKLSIVRARTYNVVFVFVWSIECLTFPLSQCNEMERLSP